MPNSHPLLERELTGSVIRAFHEVYNYFGYGLLESVYAGALELELTDAGHRVAREAMVPVSYKGRHNCWQRVDMIVDGRVLLEINSTEALPGYAKRQLVNYLHASDIEVGLLLHFGPKPEFHRFVHTDKRRRAAPSIVVTSGVG